MMLLYGNIADVSAEVIVNVANGKGWMGGVLGRFFKQNGVAESIHYATKGIVEREAKASAKRNPVMPGDVFVTSAGNLRARYIFHAVTMGKPRNASSIDVVRSCLESILLETRRLNIKSIALPLLGTGTGKVPVEEVWTLYRETLGEIKDINIILIRPRLKQREFYFMKG